MPLRASLIAGTVLSPAIAAAADELAASSHLIATVALMSGLGVFAIMAAVMAMRANHRADEAERHFAAERLRLETERDAANDLLAADRHITLIWAYGEAPQILGDPDYARSLTGGGAVEAFASWLGSNDARKVAAAVQQLQLQGTGFHMLLETLSGQDVEMVGAPVGGKAVLRIRAVDGLRHELAEARRFSQNSKNRSTALANLTQLVPLPIWQRDGNFDIVWTNEAYAKAVDGGSADQPAEFLDREDRDAARKALATAGIYRARVTATASGERRSFDVIEAAATDGSAAVAIDVTDVDKLRVQLKGETETHKRTLDQLATAIAIFDSSAKLVFHNAAYRRLWGLEHGFLESQPSESEILDKLREMRKLPEQADFRDWKRQLQDMYRAVKLEPRESQWFLPDGRTLRVVQNPDESGGVTYVFDDLTENFALQSQFTALNRVQTETLDQLKEAVAVFSSAGQLHLFNPAFGELYAIENTALAAKPHIDEIVSHCAGQSTDDEPWRRLKTAVAGLRDKREPLAERVTRKDGVIIDLAAVPMPDGGTLVTSRNVTADVTMQRTLTDHNQALEAANRIKTDFVQNVSYQLRTPLTTIIGFAQVLGDTGVGDLNERQREYLGYITTSSSALLAIINDILDLATVDAGVMSLEVAPVDIIECMKAAAEGVRSRLIEGHIGLEIRTQRNIGTFTADEARIRQILFNLLSNAITYSKAGDKVILEADRQGASVIFRVRDSGPGMDEAARAKAFDRFETERSGDKFRGAGLGLSIVKAFVDLHQGHVDIQSAPGEGTTVSVTLPASASAGAARAMAE